MKAILEPMLASGSIPDVPADDLRFVLITSAVQLESAGNTADAGEFFVHAAASEATKCERCWHWRRDVGVDAKHPTICGRCTANLFGAGEPRRVA